MAPCRQIEPLLLSEPDGTLDAAGLAQLEAHVAGCPDCRRQRAQLAAAAASLKQTSAAFPVPSAPQEWLTLRNRLRGEQQAGGGGTAGSRWWFWGIRVAALGAAAAIACIAYLRPPFSASTATGKPLARAEFVRADNAASTLVYVDQESGWLIVWADSPAANGRG